MTCRPSIPETELDFESWKRDDFEHPDLSNEGSFVAFAGERPVSLAFLTVDPGRRLAYNQMTGTLPDYRRRGLALLVKLARRGGRRRPGSSGC